MRATGRGEYAPKNLALLGGRPFRQSEFAATVGALMRPPPRYSVSPWPGGTVPTFSDMLREALIGFGLMEWRPSLREQIAAQMKIEALAVELEDLDSGPEAEPAKLDLILLNARCA